MKRLLASFVIVVLPLLAFSPAQVQAVELLTNGDMNLVDPAGTQQLLPTPTDWIVRATRGATDPYDDGLSAEPQFNLPDAPVPGGFTLSEFRTGGAPAETAEIIGGANQPAPVEGEMGLNNKAWAGGSMSADRFNSVLTQTRTVSGAVGQNFTFSGWSWWENNYSGAVGIAGAAPFLDPSSPFAGGSSTVASPTETTMELAFLSASDAVLGSHTLDLRTERTNDDVFTWVQHDLMGTAPTNTAKIRVTASMLDGVWNIDPGQASHFDNFSLTRNSAPGTEILQNANLNEPLNANGLLFKAFTGNPPWDPTTGPVTAHITQDHPATPGTMYTLTGQFGAELHYSGIFSNTGTPENPGPITTKTEFALEFLNASNVVIGGSVLDLEAGLLASQGNGNRFSFDDYMVMATAPAGTTTVRVRASMFDGYFTTDVGGGQALAADNFSLTAGVPGDHNGDGQVNLADYVVWRKTDGSQAGYDAWFNNFGAPGSGSGSLSGTVPEPACCLLAVFAMLGSLGFHRCRRSAR